LHSSLEKTSIKYLRVLKNLSKSTYFTVPSSLNSFFFRASKYATNKKIVDTKFEGTGLFSDRQNNIRPPSATLKEQATELVSRCSFCVHYSNL
jgi:hypothetical protein